MPIRVLQVVSRLNRGGAETMIMNMYRRIDRSLVQFDFVEHTEDECIFDKEAEELGARIFRVPRYHGLNHYAYCRIFEKIYTDHPEIDVVHGHMTTTAGLYLPIAKKYGKKTVVHAHNDSYGHGLQALIRSAAIKNVPGCAERYLACSKAAGLFYFGDKIVLSGAYDFFPNGIDIDKFKYDPDKRKAFREEFYIAGNTVFIGVVGRVTPPKNPLGVIEICSRLFSSKENRERYRFIWVGTGELEDDVRKKIDEKGLSDYMIMAGVRSDIDVVLSGLDIFIMPSAWEGLGIAAIEAQASGLPCLVSDRLHTEANVTGMLKYLPIDKGYDIWADAIRETDLQRYDRCDQIRAAGFDVDDCARWLQDMYLEIASKG